MPNLTRLNAHDIDRLPRGTTLTIERPGRPPTTGTLLNITTPLLDPHEFVITVLTEDHQRAVYNSPAHAMHLPTPDKPTRTKNPRTRRTLTTTALIIATALAALNVGLIVWAVHIA